MMQRIRTRFQTARRTRGSLAAALALGLLAVTPLAQAGWEDDLRQYLDRFRHQIPALREGLNTRPFFNNQPRITARSDQLPLGRNGVYVLFTTNNCSACLAAKARLDRIPQFVVMANIDEKPQFREAWLAAGAPGLPAMLIGPNLLSGFSEEQFRAAKELDPDKNKLINMGSSEGGA